MDDESTEKCSLFGMDVEEMNFYRDNDLGVADFTLLRLNEDEVLDFKDPGTWPEKILDSQRTHIVKMRKNYNEELDFTRSERDGRSVNISWFLRIL